MNVFDHEAPTSAWERRRFNMEEAAGFADDPGDSCPECGEPAGDCDCFNDCPPGRRASFDCACGRCAGVFVAGPR